MGYLSVRKCTYLAAPIHIMTALEANMRILHFGVLGTGPCIKQRRLQSENMMVLMMILIVDQGENTANSR